MRSARLLGAIVLCLTACRQEPHRASRPALSVDTIPVTEVRATAPNGTIILGNVPFATRLSNGNVVVSDANASDIALRVFDSTGGHLFDFGHQGEGPGEFEDISALTHCTADSVVALDMTQRRVIVFSPSGDLGRTVPVGPTVLLFCSTHGISLAVGPIVDFFRPTLQNAGHLQHMAVDLMTVSDTMRLYDSLPAVDPRFGGRFPAFAVAGDRAIIGLTDSAFAAVFAADGTRLSPIRVSDDPQPQTQVGFERTLDAWFTKYPGLADQKAYFLKLPHPELAPAYFALYGSPDGTIWTELSAPDDSVTHLRATDSLGITIGDVTLPFPLTIFEIGNDYILGRRENEAGEQRVVVYRIGRMGEMGGMGR